MTDRGSRLRRLNRHLALNDLVLFVPLAIPVLGSAVLDLLLWGNARLELPGSADPDPLTYLLIHLMASFGAVFAWARLRGSLKSPHLYTVAIKAIAVTFILLAVLAGAPAILIGIAVLDGAALLILLMVMRCEVNAASV